MKAKPKHQWTHRGLATKPLSYKYGQASHDFSRIKLPGIFVLCTGIGLSDQDFIIGVYHWMSDKCHIGFYQNEPSIGSMTVSEYDRFQRYVYIYLHIYIYIVQNHYGPGLVSKSDMILSYKFSKAWGLYFIWMLDSIEPSWQPETCVKFSSKTISHLRDFMGSGICSSWQGNMSGCVDVSVAMQVGLSNVKWR